MLRALNPSFASTVLLRNNCVRVPNILNDLFVIYFTRNKMGFFYQNLLIQEKSVTKYHQKKNMFAVRLSFDKGEITTDFP